MRNGDETAFTELYARHHAVARRVASTYRCRTDADDLVNEAFEKVLGALRRGHGPTDAFRAYLFVTLRRLAAESAERPRDERLDELPDPVIAVAAADELEAEDRHMIVTAFGSLPERWQTVLWHTAVEGRKPGDLAGSLGMSPNAVSALAYRAREQLRQAYLQAHLRVSPRPQCEPHRSMLGAYVRDGLSRRERAATENHLDHCSSCHLLVDELNEVNQLLVRAIVPLFLAFPSQGIGAAAGATPGATAAARIGRAGATASSGSGGGAAGATGSGLAGAAGAGVDPTTVHRLVDAWSWLRDAIPAAGGLAAAAAVVVGMAAGTLVLRHEPHRQPDVAVADEGGAAAPSTSATTAPATPARSANPPCAVLAGTDASGATAGADDATAASGDDQSAAIDEAGAVGTADADTPAASSPTVSGPATTETVSDPATDAPTVLGGVLSGLLGSDENADADVPDAADTPVPAPGTSARLNDPRCVTHEGGGRKLTVGVTNPADETAATTTEEPSVAVGAEVLDAVSLQVQLDHGVTALDLHLPPQCEVDDHDRSIVSCLFGELLPGATANATLDLGLDGDGGGATVTVKNGDTTLDVQALDLLPALPALPDLTKGLLPGG